MTHMTGRIMPEPVESATKASELTTELVKKNDEIVKAAETQWRKRGRNNEDKKSRW